MVRIADMEKIKITQEEKEVFEYLNQLQQSGDVNMFGARPFIAAKFLIDRVEAGKMLSKWMENYNEDGYEDLV